MTESHISTKDKPGDYDAIETAKPGEPLFPIQGGDPFGPPTVLHWAKLAREAGEASDDERESDRLLRKATSAEQVAWAMQEYQRGEQEVVAERANYTDAAPADANKWRAGLIGGTKHLHEAAYHFTNAAEYLPADQAAAIRVVVENIKKIASDYEPKRASYPSKPELPTA